MGLNLVFNKEEAHNAFNLIGLMPQQSTDGLNNDQIDSNISIRPPLDEKASRREVKWNFTLPLFVTDEPWDEEWVNLINSLVGLVPGLVAGAGSGLAGNVASAISNAGGVTTALINAGKSISDIMGSTSLEVPIGCRSFDVSIENNNGSGQSSNDSVWVGARLTSRSWWLSTEDEEDNKGFFKGEALPINNRSANFRGYKRRSEVDEEEEERTGEYILLLGTNHEEIDLGQQTSFPIHFTCISRATADSGGFGNLHLNVTLEIFVSLDRESLLEDLAFAEDVLPETDESDTDEYVAYTSLNNPVMSVVMQDIVPKSKAAGKLLERIAKGKVPHLGLYLSKMKSSELYEIAEGVGLKSVPANSNDIAAVIAKKLIR